MSTTDDEITPEPGLVTANADMPVTPRPPRTPRPVPMSSRIIGGVGRTLITTGVLILLFVVYQLWGTGIREAASQDDLKSEFAAIEHIAPTATAVTVAPSSTSTVAGATTTIPVATTTTLPAKVGNVDPAAPPKSGAGIAHLVIPKIGVDKYVVQGVSVDDLKRAPGHYANTVFPGQKGNSAIAGHRTTYGAPFNRLDELAVGDEIKVTTLQGTFTYVIDHDSKVVDPSDVSVLDNTPDEARLTLTTCNPKYSAATRLIVTAKLKDTPVTPLPATSVQNIALPVTNGGADPLSNEGTAQTVGSTVPGATTSVPAATAPAPVASFEGTSTGVENKSVLKAIFWGSHVLWALSCALVWIGAWLLGRKWRKWPSYAIALVPFLFLLFFFFEGVGNNLPPGV